MTALAAIPMGIHVRFLVPEPADSVKDFADVHVGDWTQPDVLKAFAEGCDAITVESEWAPADLVTETCPNVPVWPHPVTLTTIRDKGVQKASLSSAQLPLAAFALPRTVDEALVEAEALGYPCLIKRRMGSYDGYGNATVHTPEELRAHWDRLAQDNGALLEAFAPFTHELSVLIARREDGEYVMYPVARTEQRDHRCHAVEVPSRFSAETDRQAQLIALRAVETLGGVGLIAVEMFLLPNGDLLINEVAPRPHNTGHYSIEGCVTSQFENHVRAVLGLPLGNPALRAPHACMVNVLGYRTGTPFPRVFGDALILKDAHIHLYGKEEVRPRRKMGHVTVLGQDPEEIRAHAEHAASLLQL